MESLRIAIPKYVIIEEYRDLQSLYLKIELGWIAILKHIY